jgi:hypothetical protein
VATAPAGVFVNANYQDLVRELTRRDDWRRAIADMALPPAEASALRVAVIRARVFGTSERSVSAPRRAPRRGQR